MTNFMISKPLNEITIQDLDRLKNNAVPEGLTIEYKSQLPTNSDSDRKEFLADISSFANANGGDLIFGIMEKDGTPEKIEGIEIKDTDEEIRKYENMIRDGIEPRINVSSHTIQLDNNKYILIFRIVKGWNGPHRVIFKDHDKFYSRNSAGKYPLDTSELRTAFNLTQTLHDKIEYFRKIRVSKISLGETFVPLHHEQMVVLHLIPLESFTPGFSIELAPIVKRNILPWSIGVTHGDIRINFEGVLSYSGNRTPESSSYTQFYRNGIIEAVTCQIGTEFEQKKYLATQIYEKEILDYFTKLIGICEKLSINTPFFVFLTFLGIKDYEMKIHPSFNDEYYKIDKHVLEIPGVIVNNYSDNPSEILRPMFDLVWNACGFEGSSNFDDQGNFKPSSN